MAIQKHNTYYDASKPNSGIYFYDQNGDSKQLPIDKICSAGNGIDINGNTITYTGKDEPTLIGDSNITVTSSNSGNHTQWHLFVNSTPIVTDTSLTGENGITAHTTDISGQWIIGLESNSANYIKKIPDILDDVDALTSKSANWESSYNTLKSNSGDWLKEDDITPLITPLATKSELNTASSVLIAQTDYLSGVINNKLNTSAFNTYTANADITPYSGIDPILVKNHTISLTANYALSADVNEKFNQTSAWTKDTFQPKGEYVSASEFNNLEDIVNDIVEAVTELDNTKLDTSAFDNYSAHALDNYYNKTELDNRFEPIETDIDILKTYSAHNTVESSNDYINVQSGANKFILTFTSGDLATKTWVESVLSDFGGFEPAEPTGEDKHPDVTNPDNKKIYLVADNTAPNPDKSREWIVTGANTSTGWYCIGDTSLDLDPYLTKDEAAQTYQLNGDYLSANAFDNLSGNWESTYDTVNSNSATWEKVNDLYNVELSSTDNSIGITATTAADGTVKYDLTVDKVTLPDISGKNGISAYFDENESKYIVGLENYNDIGFAKYSTVPNTYTTSAVVSGYQEDLNVNPTKIALTDDQILLKNGFYHIDAQINFIIGTADNNYYDVMVKSIPNAASITQMIDASYKHTETVDLSFDVRITNDDTPIEISVENYKTNETFAVTNLNIHEIVSMPSQIDSGVNNYQAGNGIAITNDTIEARLGNGLAFNESNAIQIKLGKGLKFDESQGVQAVAITIDNDVEDVVKDVNKLQVELDTKITDNFPPSMITLADLQVANGTQYAPGNGGMLIGYLFTCPITHNIYANNVKYQTKIGIYTKQWSGNNNKVILGIYEYNPDYNENGQIGRTVALCDTGIIDLQQGYAEYEIKNLGNDTSHEMTPGKFYYATIYLSYLAGDTYGITLFGAPGYNTQVNALKPGITITNIHKIRASLYDGLNGYSPDLNFDQMGFSWQYDSYPPQEGTPYTSQDIVEAHAAGRPYFAIRNIKK